MRGQSVDAAIRSVFLRFLNRDVRAEPPASLPDWRTRPYRVLFLRDDRVGDMVVSLSIMRAIAESSPTITLDVLASPSNASLARGVPWISDVIVNDSRSVVDARRVRRDIGRRGYDVVIDGRSFVASVNIKRTLMLRAAGARWRIGLAGRRNGEIFNVAVEAGSPPHWIDLLAALARPFGVAPETRDWRPQLRVTDAARANAERRWSALGAVTPRVLVNLSAGERNRRWPDERWLALLRHLRDRLPRAPIAVMSMPADHPSAAQLSSTVAGVALTLGLDDAIATIATADLVITPDTAISHIASAFEQPTLTLLRKGFELMVPYRTPGRNVFSDDNRTLEALPATRVIAALDEVIAEQTAAHRWGTA